MSTITKQDLSTSYGTPITIPAEASEVEVWGVDDNVTPTAMAAIWCEVSDGTTKAPVLIAAGSTYVKRLDRSAGVRQVWTLRLKSVAATPDGLVVVT